MVWGPVQPAPPPRCHMVTRDLTQLLVRVGRHRERALQVWTRLVTMEDSNTKYSGVFDTNSLYLDSHNYYSYCFHVLLNTRTRRVCAVSMRSSVWGILGPVAPYILIQGLWDWFGLTQRSLIIGYLWIPLCESASITSKLTTLFSSSLAPDTQRQGHGLSRC